MSNQDDWPSLIGGDDSNALPAKTPDGVTRIQFDFHNTALENLDRLVKEHGCETRAELLRKALIYFDKSSKLFHSLD